MKFIDYFNNCEHYPANILYEDILPINTLWGYVSDSLLNGFINYVEIQKASH
jgi:hypothetical protein